MTLNYKEQRKLDLKLREQAVKRAERTLGQARDDMKRKELDVSSAEGRRDGAREELLEAERMLQLMASDFVTERSGAFEAVPNE